MRRKYLGKIKVDRAIERNIVVDLMEKRGMKMSGGEKISASSAMKHELPFYFFVDYENKVSTCGLEYHDSNVELNSVHNLDLLDLHQDPTFTSGVWENETFNTMREVTAFLNSNKQIEEHTVTFEYRPNFEGVFHMLYKK